MILSFAAKTHLDAKFTKAKEAKLAADNFSSLLDEINDVVSAGCGDLDDFNEKLALIEELEKLDAEERELDANDASLAVRVETLEAIKASVVAQKAGTEQVAKEAALLSDLVADGELFEDVTAKDELRRVEEENRLEDATLAALRKEMEECDRNLG